MVLHKQRSANIIAEAMSRRPDYDPHEDNPVPIAMYTDEDDCVVCATLRDITLALSAINSLRVNIADAYARDEFYYRSSDTAATSRKMHCACFYRPPARRSRGIYSTASCFCIKLIGSIPRASSSRSTTICAPAFSTKTMTTLPAANWAARRRISRCPETSIGPKCTIASAIGLNHVKYASA